MIYLAYIILSFSGLQMLVSLTNLLSGKFSFRNKITPDIPVSILIPARNEEKNIPDLLNDLIIQDYRNFEVIVFDDQSTDNTAEAVQKLSAKDNRIKLIRSVGLPVGWTGKNHACHSLAKEAKGSYLLFLDADVRIGNSIVGDTVAFSEKHRLGLLSLFPKQILISSAEWKTVPVMNYILLSLLPLIFVRKSKFTSLAAANGQFMLFNTLVYKTYMPHEVYKNNRVEDIEIARFLKRKKIPVACHTGNDKVKCRMYKSYDEAVNGFSKNITCFFGNSFSMAILFWFVTTFGFVAVLTGLSAGAFSLYLVLIILTRIFVSAASGQNVLRNLVYFVPQQISMGKFIYKAFSNNKNKRYEWKGRNIS